MLYLTDHYRRSLVVDVLLSLSVQMLHFLRLVVLVVPFSRPTFNHISLRITSDHVVHMAVCFFISRMLVSLMYQVKFGIAVEREPFYEVLPLYPTFELRCG